ncbi:hypothetical protein RXV86_07005 [Alisedimentitalea sp. MJ-SS2]|uniref:hypothetical protein n=1 Tax=Aliisedimentitalea sp. MJ-SS2 TaxID=3049795 RepID=UPI00290F8693|nr:hypothetical protein [Alisedimentitalea sp. MJ-SS2]MDU8927128.1 hypothetical protein [Alisedimentitalea sp. MJ-SS2]
MTEMNDKHDLDDFFQAAQSAQAPASEALMARVMQDALAVQAENAAPAGVPSRGGRTGVFTGLFAALGGWPAMAGLGTAAVAGLWIGFSPALGLGDAVNTALGVQSTDTLFGDYATGYDFAFEEGDAG